MIDSRSLILDFDVHQSIDKAQRLCDSLHMPSNLAIDDKLLSRALKIGGRRTKRETVNEALSEYVLRRERQKVIEAFGTVDYYEDYDPKKFRK